MSERWKLIRVACWVVLSQAVQLGGGQGRQAAAGQHRGQAS